MRDSDGKVRRALPEDPRHPWVTYKKNPKPRGVINDIDGIGSRANALCEKINKRMEEAKKTLLKKARQFKDDDRQAHELESFVRDWCRDPSRPENLVDAYAIGYYGVGALYLVAYAKLLSAYAEQYVDDFELYRGVGAALRQLRHRGVKASNWRLGKFGPLADFTLYKLAELLESSSDARIWIEQKEGFEEYIKSRKSKRMTRKV